MKNIRLLLLLLALPFLSLASNDSDAVSELSGVVYDENNQPLPGATIFIPDLEKGAITDQHGVYKIKNISPGTYLVQARFAGYKTQSRRLSLADKTTRNWNLTPVIIEGDEVVITGVSQATEVRKQPTHISIINQQQLQKTTTDNLIGKITDQPGVSAVSTGPNVMKPVIRGLSYNRIVVVNDGIRQEGQQWGDEHGIEIDSYAAGTVEILRGASSLLYGSDALGGVLHILPEPSALQNHISGSLITNYQSNNGLITYHGDIKGNENGLTWYAYGTGKSAHDYKNKADGYVFNSKYKEANFGGSLGLNKDWGFSRLSYSSYDMHLGISEGERDETTGRFLKEVALPEDVEGEEIVTSTDFKRREMFAPWQRVQHRKLAWNNKLRTGSGSLNAILGFQQNHRREYEEVLEPDEPGLNLLLNTFNYNLNYSFKETSGWSTTFGVSGMAQHNKNGGDEFLIPDYRFFEGGLFGITQKNLRQFTFTGGLRYDIRQLKSQSLMDEGILRFSAFDRTFNNFSGSAGISYQPNEVWIFKANVSRGFRAPAISELASNGVHEGTFRYETGNQQLKPEVSLEWDIGAIFNTEHVSASIYGYYNSIDHYIYTQKLSSISGGDSLLTKGNNSYPVFQYQQTKARLYGTEAMVDIHPHPLDWLHFKNTFSFVRGINQSGVDSTRNLPDLPAAKWVTELGFQLGDIGNYFRKTFLELELNNTFAQNHFLSAFNSETATPSYQLLDVNLGSNITNAKGKTLLKVFFSIQNLTDQIYQDHLSRLKYLDTNHLTGRRGIFNMGRNYSLKLIFPFDLKKS